MSSQNRSFSCHTKMDVLPIMLKEMLCVPSRKGHFVCHTKTNTFSVMIDHLPILQLLPIWVTASSMLVIPILVVVQPFAQYQTFRYSYLGKYQSKFDESFFITKLIALYAIPLQYSQNGMVGKTNERYVFSFCNIMTNCLIATITYRDVNYLS